MTRISRTVFQHYITMTAAGLICYIRTFPIFVWKLFPEMAPQSEFLVLLEQRSGQCSEEMPSVPTLTWWMENDPSPHCLIRSSRLSEKKFRKPPLPLHRCWSQREDQVCNLPHSYSFMTDRGFQRLLRILKDAWISTELWPLVLLALLATKINQFSGCQTAFLRVEQHKI